MRWKKLGLIIKGDAAYHWMRSHAMLPVPDSIGGSLFRVYFCGRDSHNRSHIGFAIIDLDQGGKLVEYSSEPLLSPGDLGCFDDNGVSPSSIISHEGIKYLYYIGWKPRSTVRFGLIAGLAISIDGGESFTRQSRAPILHLTDKEPIMILTAPFVLKEEQLWRMWYVSGTRWIHSDLPLYNIKYAESHNGIDWKQSGIVAIEASQENETALARPWVTKTDGAYKMYYSKKVDGNSYRMGYAESQDGVSWTRRDEVIGIDVSENGWDSEMIEYPSVITYHGSQYMFYNGNNYGASGIGLAVLERGA